jgi:AraC family transcriptional activator FtrA
MGHVPVDGRHSIAIVVLEGTLALDLAVALQAFGPRPTAFLAMRDELESPYEVWVCADQDTELRTIGMALRDVQSWDRLAEADTIVVPGLDEPDRRRNSGAHAAITAAADRGARVVGLCAGVFVLGFSGVLAGRRVTTHWALADRFRELFPDVELLDDELFLDDGNILSSGGMLAAADLCLHVLRNDHGSHYANDVARLLVSPPYRLGGQAQYRTAGPMEPTGSLAPLMAWIDDHLHEPLTVRTLARQAGTSARTLSRRFEAETGMSALRWVGGRRIERAKAMLEDTDVSVTDIAFATGFGSLSTFRRQFAIATSTTPRDYRHTFRQTRRRGVDRGLNGATP